MLTLFTTRACRECVLVRRLLHAYDIPFHEESVDLPEGLWILKDKSPDNCNVPVLFDGDVRIGHRAEIVEAIESRSLASLHPSDESSVNSSEATESVRDVVVPYGLTRTKSNTSSCDEAEEVMVEEMTLKKTLSVRFDEAERASTSDAACSSDAVDEREGAELPGRFLLERLADALVNKEELGSPARPRMVNARAAESFERASLRGAELREFLAALPFMAEHDTDEVCNDLVASGVLVTECAANDAFPPADFEAGVSVRVPRFEFHGAVGDDSIYFVLSSLYPRALNMYRQHSGPPRAATEVGEALNNLVVSFMDGVARRASFSRDAPERIIDLAIADPGIALFRAELRRAATELQAVNLAGLQDTELLAFFLNVYRCLYFHSTIENGAADDEKSKRARFEETLYVVGNLPFSLNDIEHGILRGNSRKPGRFVPQFSEHDERVVLSNRLAKYRPFPLFAFIFPHCSSPPTNVFEGDTVLEALRLAASGFCDEEVGLRPDRQKIVLPGFFSTYGADFGNSQSELMQWLVTVLPKSGPTYRREKRKAKKKSLSQKMSAKMRRGGKGPSLSLPMKDLLYRMRTGANVSISYAAGDWDWLLGRYPASSSSGRALGKFSNPIAEAAKLKKHELVLSHGRINRIPHDLSKLSHLQALDLANNSISSIPDGISHLRSLRRLVLRDTNVTQLPPSISRLTELRFVDVSGTGVSLHELCEVTSLEHIIASRCGLDCIPGEVSYLRKLRVLTVSGNNLDSLPASLSECAVLELLDASRNRLKTLPDLPRSLQHLFLHCNQIDRIPAMIGNLNLVTLGLAMNNITALPLEMRKLRRLEYLDVSKNAIPHVAYVLSSLRSLLYVRVDRELPCDIPSEYATHPVTLLLYVRKLAEIEESALANMSLSGRSLVRTLSGPVEDEQVGEAATTSGVSEHAEPGHKKSPSDSVRTQPERVTSSGELREVAQTSLAGSVSPKATSTAPASPKAAASSAVDAEVAEATRSAGAGADATPERGDGQEDVGCCRSGSPVSDEVHGDSGESDGVKSIAGSPVKSLREEEFAEAGRAVKHRSFTSDLSDGPIDSSDAAETHHHAAASDASPASAKARARPEPTEDAVEQDSGDPTDTECADACVARTSGASSGSDAGFATTSYSQVRAVSIANLSRSLSRGASINDLIELGRPDLLQRDGAAIRKLSSSLMNCVISHMEQESTSLEQVGPLQVIRCERYVIEDGSGGLDRSNVGAGDELMLAHPHYYYRNLFLEKPHLCFIRRNSPHSVCLAVVTSNTSWDFRVLLRTTEGDKLFTLQRSAEKKFAPKEIAKILQKHLGGPPFAVLSSCEEEVLALEEKLTVIHHKVGVLYAKGGQFTENEFYNNEHGSEAFETFLRVLGDRIPLRGWDKFSGGLDTELDRMGTHSIFRDNQLAQTMFHVSTYLPFLPGREQQIERKCHLGNDIVLIIFADGRFTFDPEEIASQFNCGFIIVQPLEEDELNGGEQMYRMYCCSRKEMGLVAPCLPTPPLFNAAELGAFILEKAANMEQAAWRKISTFSNAIKRARGLYLAELLELGEQAKKKKGGFFSRRKKQLKV